jgi:SLT domain-containing protein/phage-related protein
MSLSPAAIPIASSLIPAIAGVGLASIAAAAGVGVLKLGLSGISDAFQAEQDLNTQTTQNASKNAQQIADAERSLADARQQAADAAITSAERVASAEQSLADAQRSASEEVQNALQGQERAEQSLADAQRQALRAQQALNDARQAAARNLQDLQLAAIQADLDQRSATLQLAQAQQALAAARANPFAAPGQVEQAQLQLDEAQLAAQRAAVQKQRAGEDLSTAQQQGVEGAPGVVSAQDALLNARQGVSAAQQQVANAARALADAQISAAERVANAQQAVTDAYRQQAQTARQSAEAIIRAQEGVASAQNANAAAATKAAAAMAALSPAGREFVQFLQQVKPLFDSIGLAAQQALLPGIQAGIQALLPVLPAIRDLVAQIAGGIGQLAKGLGETLAGPFWQDFFRTVGAQIVPVLQTMGQILGNVAEGGARVFVALLPLANAFGQALARVSERFVEWARSPALAQFVDYVQRSVDVVWPLLSAIGDAVLQLLPPLAEWGLAIVKALAPVIEKLLPPLVRLVSDVAGVFTAAWAELAGPLSELADLLAGALTDAITALEPLLPPLIDVFKTLVRDGVVPLIRDGLRPLLQEALPPLLGLIPQFAPVIKTLGDAFAQILPPLVDVVTTLVQALVPIIKDLAPIAKPLLEAFAGFFDFYVKNAVVPILRDWLIPSMQAVADILKWLVQKVVDPMMKDYARASQEAWDALKPIWDALKNVVSDAARGWQDGLRDLQAAWDILEKIVGTPVKAVIDLTYNDGLVPMWNQMAFLVGAPQISKVNTSGIPHFAGGGVLPGYAPGVDSILARVSPGEAVLVPELVRAIGPANILALNAAYSGRPAAASGTPMFAGGGLVDVVLGLAGQSGNTALTNPLGALTKATGSNSSLVQLLAQIPEQLLSKSVDYLWNQFTSLGSSRSGASKGVGAALANSGQLDSWIAAAIAFAGVPASWAPGLRTLIMRESGGNPRAINNWDINAQRGDPSRGLMQTIGATFNAYRDPRLSADIYDPLANIVAGIRYIIARYGDISRVQQANPAQPPMGYDAGGLLPPGLSTVFNGTGRPEPVFTQSQFDALTNPQSVPMQGWEISGELTVDGMDARIDGRIRQATQRTGTAIAQRSRI